MEYPECNCKLVFDRCRCTPILISFKDEVERLVDKIKYKETGKARMELEKELARTEEYELKARQRLEQLETQRINALENQQRHLKTINELKKKIEVAGDTTGDYQELRDLLGYQANKINLKIAPVNSQ